MIPKRIFMVWLGNAVPAYVHAAVETFRHEYPDYDMEFVRYKSREIRLVCDNGAKTDVDNVLATVAHEVFALGGGVYGEYVENQKLIYGNSFKKLMMLSDVFRLGLLNAFGGVYVDADSVPGRKFDSQLMGLSRFCVSKNEGGKVIPDNYFMGQAAEYETWTNPMDASQAQQVFDSTKTDVQFQYRRAKFAKGIPSVVPGNFYVEHYALRTWETFRGMAVDDF